jgi:hypothetical protein
LENRFVGHGRTKEGDNVYLTIHFYDSGLKRGKEIYRIKHWFQGKRIDPILHGRFRLARRGNPIFYVHDNRVFIEGEDGDVHVFNRDGEFVEKVLVPLAEENIFEFYHYTIHDGKVFQLIDNFETEEWELHVTRMK